MRVRPGEAIKRGVRRHIERFTVRISEMDAHGELSLVSLAGYMQEVASHHARVLGCGFDDLRGRGLTWVLARQRVELLEPVVMGDEVEVASWPSGIRTLFAMREFSVSRAGKDVARATTAWFVMDIERRRPVRPREVLDPSLREEFEPVTALSTRLPALTEAAEERHFQIRYGDIDVNRHVTNTAYMGWALESVPVATWSSCRATGVEVHHVAEALYGDEVRVRTAPEEGQGLLHAIVRASDDDVLARARTWWRPR